MAFDVSTFWDSLGTSWVNFQDKATVEAFWNALLSGINTIDLYENEVQKSRSLPYMSPTFDSGPDFFNLVYSGLDSELTVTLLSSGGLFEYPISPWTYSIPILTTEYKYKGTLYTQTYTEGVDYTISGLHLLIWGDTPPTTDIRFSDKGVLMAYAPNVYRINPALMNVWARICGFTINDLSSYGTYGQDQYKHLKHIIWGLSYKQLQSPSIKTLRDAYGIARGLPFAYESGLATYLFDTDHYEITIEDDIYVLPSGVIPIASGYVNKFDIICSGLSLWDYTTNAGLVNNYANLYNNKNYLLFDLDVTITGLSYSTSFFADYIDKIMPKQVTYLTI